MEMAGAARGAVSSLLGSLSSVLVDEVKQLWGVRRALQSIKDEMESMNSFLLDLEEVDRPSHQQRAWMRQVRDLAKSAERCIGLQQALILREGHRSKGFLGYLPPLQTLHARHKLAKKVRELNERIKGVNERRLRYDAKILEKSSAKPSGPEATSSSSQAAGEGDEGIIPSDNEQKPWNEAMSAIAFAEPRILEKCTQKLVNWLMETDKTARTYQEAGFLAISIAAPDKEDGADVAHEALAHPSVAAKFEHKLWIKVKLQRFMPMPPSPSDILDSILRELLHEPEREPEPQEDTAELQVLNGKRVLIVLDGLNYVYKWEETIKALSGLGCAIGSAVIATTNYTLGSEELCIPRQLPIIYSLVHFYYCKVLDLTSRLENKDYNVYIFRDILERCKRHEFCMKIFAHALYASPNRSKEELEKLLVTLDSSGSLDTKATKMLQFSYNDLHRDYKDCFLYLAIFPPGHRIRRSTLVGLWVAEGLITKENWPSSVHRAERCFDVLVNRWLVHPGDIVAAGKVKSYILHDIVHEFITKIARKEHFVETRLSDQHARPFSVLSDLQLSSSDSIENFLRKLYRMPQLPLVKVLDLEGCKTFKMKQHYLENICKKMLLLKYLSLRDTDITKLPREINNLHQLEVLDIRHTHVMTASATKHLVLLKLKLLLAGCIHPSPCDDCVRHKSFSAARLPHRIGKMTNMEVLSHVQASQRGAELKVIDKLWQLRKLGVVIHDKEAHLKYLVRVISDLSESLQSLSISMQPLQASSHGSPSNTHISFEKSPKRLESLSISGTTTSGQLLPLLVQYCDQLAKVTLHNTHLNQDNMKDLNQSAKLRCVRLRHKSYTESNLTFKKDELKKLKYLLVEGSNMTEISFEDESAPELEEIVLSSANMNNISFANGAATQLEKIVLSSINIISITFENEAAPELKEIVLSSTNMNNITFGNGAAPKLKKIALSSTTITRITFGNGAAPNLEEIASSSTNITSITFENGATPNLKKIVLSSFTSVEFLFVIIYLPVLKELELNGGRIASVLLSLFTNANQLSKVTLRDTLLKQGDLQIFAKQPNLRSLMLLDKSCDESQLTFNQDEFQKLKLLVIECFGIAKISFAKGAAPKLEKIVWSFTSMESLSGVDNLPALRELEFNGDKIPNQVKEAIEAHRKPVVIEHNQPHRVKSKQQEAQLQRFLDSN